jgi:peroxiredoxin
MLSDTKSFFSKNHGWAAGMGDRNGRWAMVVDKDGTIIYAEKEPGPGVTVSILCHFMARRLHSLRFLEPKRFFPNYK